MGVAGLPQMAAVELAGHRHEVGQAALGRHAPRAREVAALEVELQSQVAAPVAAQRQGDPAGHQARAASPARPGDQRPRAPLTAVSDLVGRPGEQADLAGEVERLGDAQRLRAPSPAGAPLPRPRSPVAAPPAVASTSASATTTSVRPARPSPVERDDVDPGPRPAAPRPRPRGGRRPPAAPGRAAPARARAIPPRVACVRGSPVETNADVRRPIASAGSRSRPGSTRPAGTGASVRPSRESSASMTVAAGRSVRATTTQPPSAGWAAARSVNTTASRPAAPARATHTPARRPRTRLMRLTPRTRPRARRTGRIGLR